MQSPTNAVTQSPHSRLTAGQAEERLQALVHSLLERLVDEQHGAWIAQELGEPIDTLANGDEGLIRPHYLRLKPIVGEILGGDAADEETARLSSFSILGQCAFYLYSHVLVARFYPERHLKTETIERVARHIAQFSFGALKELKK